MLEVKVPGACDRPDLTWWVPSRAWGLQSGVGVGHSGGGGQLGLRWVSFHFLSVTPPPLPVKLLI